ncbi:hypothetical protein OFAG_02207 [Oxalobacter formigenes HOxBLS]|uniref:Uncharacterized protein n=1 Tax=Oxalobacter paraformigenes TaxID=556268 RepID=T5LUR3_9BURK|nr:hypothetical protein OFAG_02207 [Oxalobacter paraformigenes]
MITSTFRLIYRACRVNASLMRSYNPDGAAPGREPVRRGAGRGTVCAVFRTECRAGLSGSFFVGIVGGTQQLAAAGCCGRGKIRGRRKAEGGRRKVGGGRWKVEGGRWKVEGGRWKVEGGRWKVEGGRWKVEGGRWKVEGGRWKVEGGRWKVEGGRWKVEGGRFFRRRRLCSRSFFILADILPGKTREKTVWTGNPEGMGRFPYRPECLKKNTSCQLERTGRTRMPSSGKRGYEVLRSPESYCTSILPI